MGWWLDGLKAFDPKRSIGEMTDCRWPRDFRSTNGNGYSVAAHYVTLGAKFRRLDPGKNIAGLFSGGLL
jgi:hypothetical protein